MGEVKGKIFLWIVLGVSVLFVFRSCAHTSQGQKRGVQLKKVFYHQNQVKSASVSAMGSDNIILGNMVFHFDSDVSSHLLSKKSGEKGLKECVFFFPEGVIANNECKRVVKEINRSKGTFYKVNIEEVKKPMQGIRVTFSFNPEKVAVEEWKFVSMGANPGIEFRLINKGLSDSVKNAIEQKRVTRVALADRPRIVIDPGHGGKDSGTFGCASIPEKQVCLAVGKQVADRLKKIGCHVFMTRSSDVYVPLEKRTTLANHVHADLFVSIHANAARNTNAHGIETFCHTSNLETLLFSSAQPEDTRMTKQFFELKNENSYLLAKMIQSSVCQEASVQNSVIDRSVKFAPFQVLIGTRMPAILVELGFLSNKQEAQLLSSPSYQERLARGICQGVCSYLQG